jgi:hypothetical protein
MTSRSDVGGPLAARRKKGRTHLEVSESTVYAGRDAVGTIVVERKTRVIALDAAGKKLGVFATEKLAMAAILAVAREGKR